MLETLSICKNCGGKLIYQPNTEILQYDKIYISIICIYGKTENQLQTAGCLNWR